MSRRWYVMLMEEALAAQGLPLTMLKAERLWLRTSEEKPPYKVRHIEAREWGAMMQKSTTGQPYLALAVGEFWQHGGGEYTTFTGYGTGEFAPIESGTTWHLAADCYLTWKDARGGWPLVGDRVVAEVPEGRLETTIEAATDDPTLWVVTGGRKLPLGCLSPTGGSP